MSVKRKTCHRCKRQRWPSQLIGDGCVYCLEFVRKILEVKQPVNLMAMHCTCCPIHKENNK